MSSPSERSEYTDLKAVYLNCTLKKSPEASHTERLMRNSIAIMESAGASVDMLRVADHDVAFGIYPDMRKHGFDTDVWPDVFWPKIRDADILVIGTPIWLGEESSLCRIVIERLYAHSGQLNDEGQSVFYGRTGGVVVTGNEDGIKHVSMTVLYALQHIGYSIPPQADCGWIGEAGPGPSYGDDGAGFDNEFTRRNTTIMTWNLMHLAGLLKNGFPRHGNQRSKLEDNLFGHPDLKTK